MNLTFGTGAALVAGGSGGIGSEVVRTLASCGIPVGFTWRSRDDEAERVIRSAGTAVPVKAWPWASSDAAAARALAEGAAGVLGREGYLG
jgi:NAD(P)-dependent dehydrogenase (short-subunit alcohol dehydrogenase family)